MKYLVCSIMMMASLWSQASEADTVFFCQEQKSINVSAWKGVFARPLGRFTMKLTGDTLRFGHGGYPPSNGVFAFVEYKDDVNWVAEGKFHIGHYIFQYEGPNLYVSSVSRTGAHVVHATWILLL